MRFTKVVIPVALCILLLRFAAPAQRKKYGRAAKPDTPLPVVSAIDTDALKGLITQQRERPLLVNFWATFCDPCRDEFPDLVKIDKEYRPQSLDFVTVSLDDIDQLKTDVPKFLSSMKATMPAYLLNVTDPEPTRLLSISYAVFCLKKKKKQKKRKKRIINTKTQQEPRETTQCTYNRAR